MKVNNMEVINGLCSVVDDLIFYDLKAKVIVLNKEYALEGEKSFTSISYLDDNKNKINVFKIGETKASKSLEDGYVMVRKKHLYLMSNREVIVVDATTKITPIDEVVDLQKKKTPYKKFEVEYDINKEESFIPYKKFDYSKYDLIENPMGLIIECIDKRIEKLQRRIDRLNSIKRDLE